MGGGSRPELLAPLMHSIPGMCCGTQATAANLICVQGLVLPCWNAFVPMVLRFSQGAHTPWQGPHSGGKCTSWQGPHDARDAHPRPQCSM